MERVSQEVSDLQNEAVEKLLAAVKIKNDVTFKSPTGSGKTFMMASFMERVLEEESDVVFLVSSLSKGDLAKQNYDKFTEYKKSNRFPNLSPFLINTNITGEQKLYIPTGFNVYILPRDLYKKGGILMQGSMMAFLTTLIGQTAFFDEGEVKRKALKIFLIKDECHIATNNLDSLGKMYFSKVINFSATPALKRAQVPDVLIKEVDAISAGLIKRVVWGDDSETLDSALTKFEEINEKYHKIGVNGAFIIQISNAAAADEEWENIIRPALDAHSALKWMYIVEKEKKCDTNDEIKKKKIPVSKWKEYAKDNNSTIDVIIFKMVITEGFDMPRAFALYQLRDTKSRQLDEQVIGRVRRNPCLLRYDTLSAADKALVTTAYIWGVKPLSERVTNVVLKSEDLKNDIVVKTTKLKSLKDHAPFDLAAFLEKREKVADSLTAPSFFDLAKAVRKAPRAVQDLIYANAKDYATWAQCAAAATEITALCNKYLCDYKESMIKGEDGYLATTSYTTASEYYTEISNWVWKKNTIEDERNEKDFSFDSYAESEWARIMQKLGEDGAVSKAPEIPGLIDGEPTLWGKNYVANSGIKFEYYTDTNHFSYPDFIMKDRAGGIHIFEVKSTNIKGGATIDVKEYMEKINYLFDAYKAASNITNQTFYIPILASGRWYIHRFKAGVHEEITKEKFIKEVLIK